LGPGTANTINVGTPSAVKDRIGLWFSEAQRGSHPPAWLCSCDDTKIPHRNTFIIFIIFQMLALCYQPYPK